MTTVFSPIWYDLHVPALAVPDADPELVLSTTLVTIWDARWLAYGWRYRSAPEKWAGREKRLWKEIQVAFDIGLRDRKLLAFVKKGSKLDEQILPSFLQEYLNRRRLKVNEGRLNLGADHKIEERSIRGDVWIAIQVQLSDLCEWYEATWPASQEGEEANAEQTESKSAEKKKARNKGGRPPYPCEEIKYAIMS